MSRCGSKQAASRPVAVEQIGAELPLALFIALLIAKLECIRQSASPCWLHADLTFWLVGQPSHKVISKAVTRTLARSADKYTFRYKTC